MQANVRGGMQDPVDGLRGLFHYLGIVFFASSLGSLAKMLSEDELLPPIRRLLGRMVLCGITGSIVLLGLWDSMQGRFPMLAAVSILSGIGGAETIEFLFALTKRIAQKITGVEVGEIIPPNPTENDGENN